MEDSSRTSGENEKGPWSWLTETSLGFIFSLTAVVSSPLAFVLERGWAWTFLIAALATWFWWWTNFASPQRQRKLFDSEKRKVSKTVLAAILPVGLSAAFIFFLSTDIGRLDIWRKDYQELTRSYRRYGSVNKVFGEGAPRLSPRERLDFESADWIRWLEAGSRQSAEGSELLFVESDSFDHKYHTFMLDVHDFTKQVDPVPQCAAFLVSDNPTYSGRRRTFRQIPCDFSSDAESRLFRVQVENPDCGEFLWLFLGVCPKTKDLDLNSLNPQLMVR